MRFAIVFANATAYRTGATGVLRRHLINVSAKSQRFPIKLGKEDSPALIENGKVETAFLCNVFAGLLSSSLRRCRHVFDSQILSENFCVVLADFQRDLLDKITADIGDMLMLLGNRRLLFVPILPELLHSCELTLHPGELVPILLKCCARLKERAVGKRTKTYASHVNANACTRMLGRLHLVFRLNGNVPPVGLTGHSHVFCFALNKAASSVLDPTDARQINLLGTLVDLKALREAERVCAGELSVFFREGCSAFEESLKACHQILQRLLKNLRVGFLQPGIPAFPNQKFTAQLGIADMEGGILSPLLFVPNKSLIVDPTGTTDKAAQFSLLSAVRG